MKKTKTIVFQGFYIFSGRACANCCFVENLDNAKKFISYMNFYFKGYLKVYDYNLSKDGWQLAVKLGKRSSVLKQLKKQDFVDQIPADDLCWKIVSERVRLFLSTFVRVTNKDRGRTGTLVHGVYDRYYFTSLKEAKSYLNDMRQQRIKHYKTGSKYIGLESQYEIDAIGSVFLSSKAGVRRKLRSKREVKVLYFKGIRDLVLESAIRMTKSLHKHGFQSKNNKIQLKI
ncbi:hypothetical protein N9B82_03225 [Saprospiraceae bacterium]|nr:hypothetical protein [Saprospiraceae bacterium]